MLLLNTAFPKGKSVSEDTFRIYSHNSPRRKKNNKPHTCKPKPQSKSLLQYEIPPDGSDKYRAVHNLHTPCSYTELKKLSNLTSCLPLFILAAGFCWGCIKLCWHSSKHISLQHVAISGTAAHLPGTAVIYIFSPPLLHLNISIPSSPRWALTLFLLVFFLTTEQIIPLAPLIKSHAKAQYHFEMLAVSLEFIIGLHHTVIFNISGAAEDYNV